VKCTAAFCFNMGLLSYHISDVMVNVTTSRTVDGGFEPWSGKTKDLLNWY
jgi:hypothetical protein